VSALHAAIRSLGGIPVEVQAYDGAIAMISAAALKSAGANIATVEARHVAHLQLLNSSLPEGIR